jgi:hypothetical protein
VFSMNPKPFECDVDGYAKVAFSGTVRWLHLPVVIFVIVLMIYAASKRS